MRGHTEREHHYNNKRQKKERHSRSETKNHKKQRSSYSEQMIYQELQRLAQESVYQTQTTRQEQKAHGHKNQERGNQSERRLFDYLTDETAFPWIQRVTIAQKSQEGYDFTIHLQTHHPFYKMLNGCDIYVDAKSSSRGVSNYFYEQSSRCKKDAKRVITLKKRIAINAGPEATQSEMDLQLALQMLVLCDAVFDEEKKNAVLELLGERVTAAYHSEIALINQYLYYYLRNSGAESTVLQ